MIQFTPPQPEELSHLFSAYQINGFIAQGGMGAVYHGIQISLDRPVAIKILPAALGEDSDYRASFEREAKAMARLNHANLVGVFDFGEVEGMLYIIMEYVPGRTLYEVAHGQTVAEKEAASLILEVCRGLQHAHEAGLIHRDIKPANILIDGQARPKVVDFGLARPFESGDSGEKMTLGTPGYTAPEVFQDPANVDQRADVYSVGIMLYELLTGGMPVDPYMSPSQAADADERFDLIVARAIQPDPNMRYASVAAMAQDLDKLLKEFDQPIPAPAPAAPATARLVTSAVTGTSAGAVVRPAVGTAMGSIGPHSATYLASSKKKSAAVPVTIAAVLAIGGIIAYTSMSGGKDQATVVDKQPVEEGVSEEEQEAMIAKAREEQRLKNEREQKLRDEEARKRELEILAFEEELKRGRGRMEEEEDTVGPVVVDDEPREVVKAFDYLDFIKDLRKDVVIASGSTVAEYNKEIGKNMDRYKRDIKRNIRKLNNNARDTVEMKAEAFYGFMEKESRIPEKVTGEHFVITSSHFQFIKDQDAIDKRYEFHFSSHRSKYLKACEDKLKELDPEVDADGIEFLKAEMEKTREDKSRIRFIARGLPIPDEEKDA